MLPGLLGGRYRRNELSIDATHLARRAGATLILGRAVQIQTEHRTLVLEDGHSVRYDLLALNIGSTISGVDGSSIAGLDGSDGEVLPARPPDRLVARFESGEPIRSVVVVGGGAAGVELAAAARTRVPRADVTLVEAGDRILPGYHERVARRATRALRRRGVEIRTENPGFPDRTDYRADVTILATGAAARAFPVRSGLPGDERGFVRVAQDLQVPGHPGIFASGDCAALVGASVPRAGVHAVRQAPVLAHNLGAVVSGATTRAYRPQTDFLTLLNLGDGTALATKWGRVAEGRWVQALKDTIDRRFVRSLQPAAP